MMHLSSMLLLQPAMLPACCYRKWKVVVAAAQLMVTMGMCYHADLVVIRLRKFFRSWTITATVFLYTHASELSAR
jgi:hypothetical protein